MPRSVPSVPPAPAALSRLVDRLVHEHAGRASADAVLTCVTEAWHAVRYFGGTDDAEMVRLAERIAERDLRLRLGLDREAARLDPENHRR